MGVGAAVTFRASFFTGLTQFFFAFPLCRPSRFLLLYLFLTRLLLTRQTFGFLSFDFTTQPFAPLRLAPLPFLLFLFFPGFTVSFLPVPAFLCLSFPFLLFFVGFLPLAFCTAAGR